MKIRNGFVSNSSSSSFCIIGVHVSETDYDKIQEMDSIIDGDFVFYHGDEYGSVFGLYPDSILETHTLAEARQIFKNKLTDVIGEEYATEILSNRSVELIYDSYYC